MHYRLKGFGREIALIIWACCLIDAGLCGQTTTHFYDGYQIEHYDVRDGIPKVGVDNIIQDQNGFLWMTNLEHILRYDGYEFLKYVPPAALSGADTDPMVYRGLTKDAAGYIWTVTPHGLLRLDPTEERFLFIPITELSIPHCPEITELEGLARDAAGHVWVGASCGLYRIMPEQDTFSIQKWSPNLDYARFFAQLSATEILPADVIAELTGMGDNEQRRQAFEISGPGRKSVVAIGLFETLGRQAVDYGWIEDATGQRVWTFDFDKSMHAGGDHKNLIQIETIQLEPGSYTLHYTSDNSHSFPDWNANPPLRPDWWGIQLLWSGKSSVEPLLTDWQVTEGLTYGEKYVRSEPLADEQGQLYVVTGDQYLKFDRENGEPTFFALPGLDDILGITTKNGIGTTNRHWFLTLQPEVDDDFFRYDLYAYDPKPGKLTKVPSEIPGRFVISALEEDHQGHLWIGSRGGRGLFKLPPPYETAKVVPFSRWTRQGLVGNGRVLSLFEDRNRNMWIGTENEFLYKIPSKKSSITYFDFHRQLNLGGQEQVHSIFVDREGAIWGDHFGELFRITKKGTEVEREDELARINLSARLRLVHQDDRGHLWFARFAGRASWGQFEIYDPVLQQRATYRLPENNTPNVLKTVARDRQGHFWLLTSSRSLYIFDRVTGMIRIVPQQGGQPTHLIPDKDQGVWLSMSSGYGGFRHLRWQDGDIDTLDFFNLDLLSHDFAQDSEGNLWLGTSMGLFRHEPGRDTSMLFAAEQGLANTMIWGIEFDGMENIWINSLGGIYQFDRSANRFRSFRQLNGFILPTYGSTNYFGTSAQGFMTIQDENGLLQFHPDSLSSNPYAPDILVSRIMASDREFTFKRNGRAPTPLTFRHFENDLSIHFTGIIYDHAPQNSYHYQLPGVDEDWVKAGPERVARYPNLPPGNYTFRVKAANADGVWTENATEITFTIQPPWWQTWWAYLAYGSGILGVLYYIRHLELKKQKQKLTLKEEKLAYQEQLNAVASKFVPNAFIHSLGREGIMDVKLGDAVAQDITVMFSDIRDYTSLSETMTLKENFRFVNTFNQRMGPVIQQHQGFVNQYLGDAIMALFKDSPVDGLRAAIQMQNTLRRFNEERKEKNLSSIRIGIGLHAGPLVMGIIGDDRRMDAATISDTVNTASRIESLTKYFSVNILLSEESLRQIQAEATHTSNRPNGFHFRFLGEVQLKGKKAPTGIYECFDGDQTDVIKKKMESFALFDQGMQMYFSRQFDRAVSAFEKVLIIHPGDLTAQHFLEKSRTFQVKGVSDEWNGIEVMTFK